MRWLLGLVLFIGLSLNGPSICEHAFADQSEPHSPNMMQHSEMDHSMHSMDHMEMSDPSDHSPHCPDDCDGGMNCEGCSIAISMVSQIAPNDIRLPRLQTRIGGFSPLVPSPSMPDIPPPKTIFFA